ncbi:MAG: 4'-phosphopantetheinyl transferase superfamily protein [Bacteroidales bacterium]|nr:4'-phosphopantetheinyl transferase superfamily protein [Bacteroidales bacterium]
MVEIYAFVIPDQEVFSRFYNNYYSCLSDLGKSKVDVISNPKNCSQSFFADLFCRTIISQKYNIPISELQFSTTGKDKPILSNHRKIHFNYSHSGSVILLGIGDCNIGVDVEGERKNMMKVANRFFSNTEIDYLNSFSGKAQDEVFCKLWTVKEAYLKYMGTGLTKPLSSFTVTFDSEKISIAEEDSILDLNIRLFALDKGFKAAVCSCGEFTSNQIQWIEINTLEKLLLES